MVSVGGQQVAQPLQFRFLIDEKLRREDLELLPRRSPAVVSRPTAVQAADDRIEAVQKVVVLCRMICPRGFGPQGRMLGGFFVLEVLGQPLAERVEADSHLTEIGLPHLAELLPPHPFGFQPQSQVFVFVNQFREAETRG